MLVDKENPVHENSDCNYYLAEVNENGIKPIDGCHGSPDEVAKALELIKRLPFDNTEDKTYVCIHVSTVGEYTEDDINEQAIADCHMMASAVGSN